MSDGFGFDLISDLHDDLWGADKQVDFAGMRRHRVLI
jgi:hypothetical protein